jgi:hypothetical protein
MYFLILSFNIYLIKDRALIFFIAFYRMFLLILKTKRVILNLFICYSLLKIVFLKEILFLN